MAKQAKSKLKVEAECSACSGTGVYHGFAEPKGVGVVCLQCEGSGKAIIEYIPFTKRQRRRDIKIVRLSKGTFIGAGVGPTGSEVSYKDFFAGQLPKP